MLSFYLCDLCDSVVQLFMKAQENMDRDRDLLKTVGSLDKPLLQFYHFSEPAATYGHFADPEKLLLAGHNLDLGKRPTGGGLIFHTHDLAFSLLIPANHPLYGKNQLESYHNVHHLLIEAITPLLPKSAAPLSLLSKEHSPSVPYCMAHATQYDLLQGGKKVGGAAQRRTKEGLLHQGSLFLHLPPLDWLASRVPAHILASISTESRPLFSNDIPLAELRSSVKETISTRLTA